jgi:hypothetical protein
MDERVGMKRNNLFSTLWYTGAILFHPMEMSEVILHLVPRKKKHNGVRTSAVLEIRLQNYSLLFL